MLVAYKGVDFYLQHYCPKKCLRVRYHRSNVWEKWGNAEFEIGLNVNHIKNKKSKKGDKPIADPATEHLSYTPPTSNLRSDSMGYGDKNDPYCKTRAFKNRNPSQSYNTFN